MSVAVTPGDLLRYNAATAHLEPPFAVVDLAAMRANAEAMRLRAAGKPIRLASKSVRCRELISQVLRMDGFRGVLAFTLPEALWLAEQGVSDQILVGYPTADRAALARLAGNPAAAASIAIMVDCPEHLDMIEKAAASVAEPHQVRVCIDIDASYMALNGLLRAGARRSPIRTPGEAVALAAAVVARPGLRLVGLMAYEGQIAGVGDRPAGRPLYGLAVRYMQRQSGAELARRRAAIVAAVRDVAPLEFVNGGGTGSLEKTAAEAAVTEIGAGSGLYQPRLFDSYRGFRGTPGGVLRTPRRAQAGPAGGDRAGRRLPGLRPSRPGAAAVPLPPSRAPAGSPGGRGRGTDAVAGCRRRPAADRRPGVDAPRQGRRAV